MASSKDPNTNAGGQQSDQGGQLRPDALVERLTNESGEPQASVMLTGFLGRSPRDGYWRLYSNPQLNEYVEFSESDVLHTQPLPEQVAPHGGTQVWLRAGTPLQHTQITTRQVQADFLQGGITAGFLPGSGISPMAIARTPAAAGVGTVNLECSRLSINMHADACKNATMDSPCPSRTPNICQPRPTVVLGGPGCDYTFDVGPCRTLIPDVCPSTNDACPSHICPPASKGAECP